MIQNMFQYFVNRFAYDNIKRLNVGCFVWFLLAGFIVLMSLILYVNN